MSCVNPYCGKGHKHQLKMPFAKFKWTKLRNSLQKHSLQNLFKMEIFNIVFKTIPEKV